MLDFSVQLFGVRFKLTSLDGIEVIYYEEK